MDKLAHPVGIDPMEFRILNAYRDGDMKAHRRVAKNTALIECVQVVAREGELADQRDGAARLVAERRWRRARGDSADGDRRERPDRPAGDAAGAATADAGRGTAAGISSRDLPRRLSAAAVSRWQPRRTIRRSRHAAPPPPAPHRRFRLPPASPQHGAARFSSVFSTGGAEMARHQGRGMASINYPIGMNLGGDPSQALVHSNPDGKFTVALSAIDLGQGMK